MCGILGVLGDLPDSKKIEIARDTMAHRGPDAFDLFYHPEEKIALAHRRLAIIDLSPAGKQPFFSHDGRFVVIFNGEIYNYQEIKKELEGSYPFKTQTDTEVLLAAFIKWGPEALHRFNGMFAFAVWDRKKKELFIARDRLGIKPLYYAIDSKKNFYFSSEIKGILAFDVIPRRLDPQSFLDYLSYRYPLGEKTMFRDIHSLLPGHYLLVDSGGNIKKVSYWQLPIISEKKDPGEQEALAKTEALLRQAVRYRMISDVPVGAFLSGGLDSSLLVAFMAELSDKPIQTFSLGFAEEGFSELSHAKEVAHLFKTDHHEYVMSGKEYLDVLPEVIRHKDAPLATQNEAALYLLSQKVKKDATVLLAGDGADELFGGYGRIFRSVEDWSRMQHLDRLEMSKEEKANLLENLKSKYGELKTQSLLDHFIEQYSYFDITSKKDILNAEKFEKNDLLNREYFADYFSRLETLPPMDQFLYVFQIVHLLGPLQRLDVPTMAASVEARVPYVDYELVEYVSSLPHSYKLAWKSDKDAQAARVLNSDQISEQHDIPKYLLKKIAEKHLPSSIVHRKKMGFPAPLDRWFQGEFNNNVKEMLLSPQARSSVLYNPEVFARWLNEGPSMAGGRKGMNIWMVFNLEMWMREYKVTL